MLRTYKAARAFTKRARSRTEGRPLNSRGWRILDEGDACAVWLHGHRVGRYLPDDTFEFTLTEDALHRVSASLSATAYVNTPFAFKRLGVGRYRVSNYPHSDGPEYFPGLTYDLADDQWLNARPDAHTNVNQEARKEWLKASREWKYAVKTLARLGVLERIEPMRGTHSYAPGGLKSAAGLDKLYKIVSDRDVSSEALSWLRAMTYTYNPSSEEVYAAFVRVLEHHSFELRKRFGVFGER